MALSLLSCKIFAMMTSSARLRSHISTTPTAQQKRCVSSDEKRGWFAADYDPSVRGNAFVGEDLCLGAQFEEEHLESVGQLPGALERLNSVEHLRVGPCLAKILADNAQCVIRRIIAQLDFQAHGLLRSLGVVRAQLCSVRVRTLR